MSTWCPDILLLCPTRDKKKPRKKTFQGRADNGFANSYFVSLKKRRCHLFSHFPKGSFYSIKKKIGPEELKNGENKTENCSVYKSQTHHKRITNYHLPKRARKRQKMNEMAPFIHSKLTEKVT